LNTLPDIRFTNKDFITKYEAQRKYLLMAVVNAGPNYSKLKT